MKSWSLDEWRKYFGSANSDIFEIIEHAIIVAASDCPKEFRVRRDGIAERLFSCRLTRCVGCDRVELAVGADSKEKHDGDGDDDNDKSGYERDGVEFEGAGASKESKVNGDGGRDVNLGDSNYSFGEAEALSDEMEEESRYVAEILRIRDVLLNPEDESEAVLFDSLRRLQLMELTVDCLKATEIGKAVNPLRKHGSKDIRQLSRTLIDGWKEMVDEWVKATTTTAITEEGTPDSVNPSVVDDDEEEGLPSPPLDEGAFFVTQAGSMELSQFFDGMDDDGNPRPTGPFSKNRENGRKPVFDSHVVEKRKSQASHDTAIIDRDVKSQQQAKKNEAVVPERPNKPVTADSGPGRPPKSNMQRKSNMEPKMQQKMENNSITRRPPTGQLDKSKRSDDSAVQVKLEATKRKLQESYQQAENAKRQRTIQVMEINDLPKQGLHRNTHFKPGYHNRHWANGRR
ncbi:putative mediator of RNA polymerase II transcription subunit 26b [Glycine max]|nr:putative mediator of RNA polymerase II transcription subunit 26b [Glycine max]KAH1194539.1 putative mediator of RNA polymerase II transcription subunit 26b [Glycine max]